jgi:GrpB-like predicted nucleotidyltransferase (UPF0157 family)
VTEPEPGPKLVSDEELGAAHVLPPRVLAGPVVLVESQTSWAEQGAAETSCVRGALGDVALQVEHVGSTSIPGLLAKPILDIVLVVADPDEESSYVPALERAGYVLHVREPWWHRHRMLKGVDPAVNLHVFSPTCAEPTRMIVFRDRLLADEEDRERYAATKRDLAARTWRYTQHYADAKSAVVEEILARTGAPSSADGCPTSAG